jgi:CDP-6-deoxy-D-xylo-4-hexulose-3-dehydrase
MTMGEGGALATNDATLKRLIESYRDWGRDCWCGPGKDDTCRKRFKWKLGTLPEGYDHKYVYSHMGYNLKLTDMQAAVGVAQLRKLDNFIAKRAANWKYLRNGLKEFEEQLILPEPTRNSRPSWFGFILTVRDGAPFTRNELTAYLEKRKVATRLLFCGNLLRHPAFQDIECRVPDGLRNTDTVMNSTFWVGVYPGLTKPMLDYVMGVFGDFMRLKKC